MQNACNNGTLSGWIPVSYTHLDVYKRQGGNFAMYAPTSGILNPFIYTIALAENAKNNGADFFFDNEVTAIKTMEDGTQMCIRDRHHTTPLQKCASG